MNKCLFVWLCVCPLRGHLQRGRRWWSTAEGSGPGLHPGRCSEDAASGRRALLYQPSSWSPTWVHGDLVFPTHWLIRGAAPQNQDRRPHVEFLVFLALLKTSVQLLCSLLASEGLMDTLQHGSLISKKMWGLLPEPQSQLWNSSLYNIIMIYDENNLHFVYKKRSNTSGFKLHYLH